MQSMKERTISVTIDGIFMSVNIMDRVCVLFNVSGAGQTYCLKSLLKSDDEPWRNKYAYFDEDSVTALSGSNILNDAEYIITLDNAEYYPDLCNEILRKSNCTFIVVTKLVAGCLNNVDYAFYKVNRTSERLEVLRK